MNSAPVSKAKALVALALAFSFLIACSSASAIATPEPTGTPFPTNTPQPTTALALGYRTISSAYYYYAEDVKDCSSFRKSYGEMEQGTTLEATGRTAVCNDEILIELQTPPSIISSQRAILIPERSLERVDGYSPPPTPHVKIETETVLECAPVACIDSLTIQLIGDPQKTLTFNWVDDQEVNVIVHCAAEVSEPMGAEWQEYSPDGSDFREISRVLPLDSLCEGRTPTSAGAYIRENGSLSRLLVNCASVSAAETFNKSMHLWYDEQGFIDALLFLSYTPAQATLTLYFGDRMVTRMISPEYEFFELTLPSCPDRCKNAEVTVNLND